MSRHTRLTPGVTLYQRQTAMAEPCDVPGCTRPRAVFTRAPGGLIRMRRWCEKHRYSKNRPLVCQLNPQAEAIPAHVKIYPCTIPLCPQVCEVERAARLIDNVPTAGWKVRPYCKAHRNPASRPVGWLPPPCERLTQWRWQMRKFLGIKRWMDRGYFDGKAYRLQVGHTLYIVDQEAISGLRGQLALSWAMRESLGVFAARYNLAIAAVVGATYALREHEGHGEG